MLEVVIFFLLVSVYLYCLLGGADFGAGIIELTSGKSSKEVTQKLVNKAMAPIWEANHMWLIITVVILFNGFPKIYSKISISLYIPLILLLVGIILRGTAFTFRYYDAIKDDSQNIYSRIFEYSSVLVSFFFGIIIGALVSGKIQSSSTGFVESYILPWFNLFSVSTGIFTSTIFAFIAAVYLIGETTEVETKLIMVKKAKRSAIIMVLSGGFVFVSSLIEQVQFAELFMGSSIAIIMILAATVLLPVLWLTLDKTNSWLSRILAGSQLFLILGAFYIVYFPSIIILDDGRNYNLLLHKAPDITLAYLGWALLIGSLIIFPSLFYLFRVFKTEKNTV